MAEVSLRPLVELHREAAVVVGADGRLLAANRQAVAALGADDRVGSLCDLAADEPAEVIDLIRRILDAPAPVPIGLTLHHEGRLAHRIFRGAPVGVHQGVRACLLVLSSSAVDSLRDEPSLREKAAELAVVNAQSSSPGSATSCARRSTPSSASRR
jgi:hypothetical protein